MDLAFPAIGGGAYAARCLVLYNSAPMGPSFCSGHLLPPNDEVFSLSESIAERRIVEKTGWSHAYMQCSPFFTEITRFSLGFRIMHEIY